MAQLCALSNQDLALLDLDMANLTLRPQAEEQPRRLQCFLLQPGEDNVSRPLSSEEIGDLFANAGDGPPDLDVFEEGDECEVSENEAEEVNAGEMEAQNLMPPRPMDADDGTGDPERSDKQADVEMEYPLVPVEIAEVDGEDASWLDDSFFSDEEVLEYEPISKGALPPREDAVYNSEAASSSGRLPMGHFATPDDVRRMIPPGSKIQHRRAKSERHCSGWQAWPGIHERSRFFSYGAQGHYGDRESALQAAVAFCWGSQSK